MVLIVVSRKMIKMTVEAYLHEQVEQVCESKPLISQQRYPREEKEIKDSLQGLD